MAFSKLELDAIIKKLNNEKYQRSPVKLEAGPMGIGNSTALALEPVSISVSNLAAPLPPTSAASSSVATPITNQMHHNATVTTAAAAQPAAGTSNNIVMSTRGNSLVLFSKLQSDNKPNLDQALNTIADSHSVEDNVAKVVHKIIRNCEAGISGNNLLLSWLSSIDDIVGINKQDAIALLKHKLFILAKVKELADALLFDELFWFLRVVLVEIPACKSSKLNKKILNDANDILFRDFLKDVMIKIAPYRSALLFQIKKKKYFNFSVVAAGSSKAETNIFKQDKEGQDLKLEYEGILKPLQEILEKIYAGFFKVQVVKYKMTTEKERQAIRALVKSIREKLIDCDKIFIGWIAGHLDIYKKMQASKKNTAETDKYLSAEASALSVIESFQNLKSYIQNVWNVVAPYKEELTYWENFQKRRMADITLWSENIVKLFDIVERRAKKLNISLEALHENNDDIIMRKASSLSQTWHALSASETWHIYLAQFSKTVNDFDLEAQKIDGMIAEANNASIPQTAATNHQETASPINDGKNSKSKTETDTTLASGTAVGTAVNVPMATAPAAQAIQNKLPKTKKNAHIKQPSTIAEWRSVQEQRKHELDNFEDNIDVSEKIEFDLKKAKDCYKSRMERLIQRRSEFVSKLILKDNIRSLLTKLFSNQFSHEEVMQLEKSILAENIKIKVKYPSGGSSHYTVIINGVLGDITDPLEVFSVRGKTHRPHGSSASKQKNNGNLSRHIILGLQDTFRRAGFTEEILRLQTAAENSNHCKC